MHFLAVQSMKTSLYLSIWLNKITGRSSKECMHKFYLYSMLFLVLFRIGLSVGFRDYFVAGLTIGIWGVLYPVLHMFELKVYRKDFWDQVESNYKPPNIMLCNLVFPFYNWRSRIFDVKMWMFFVLFQFVFSIASFIQTHYYYGVLSLTSMFLFFIQSLWSSNNFFYHQMNDTSLYSKVKKWLRQKMENREKVSVLAPIPA